jgi:hypothetical protein
VGLRPEGQNFPIALADGRRRATLSNHRALPRDEGEASMSETTPDSEKKAESSESTRSHLQAVREEAPKEIPAHAGPVRQSGGHMTGLLALLLAVAVFALLAQFSTNRQLQAENAELQATLATTQAELEEARGQMDEARDAVGGLRDVLERIETLLAPKAPAAAPSGGEAAAAKPPVGEAPAAP